MKKKILIAPLDWGLGHATRCVPLIRALRSRGVNVVLGASGKPLSFLKGEFPDLEWVEIPSVEITYQEKGSFLIHLLRQMPAILRAIRHENDWLIEHSRSLGIDAVISDNRYGLYLPDKYSVIMTHQVFPDSPWYGQFLVNQQVKHWLARFDQVWVPDYAGPQNLSGALSHGAIPAHTRYIGPLSRFKKPDQIPDSYLYEYLGLVSGPEPQRTYFQQKLIELFNLTGKPSAVICGLPDFALKMSDGCVNVIPHLKSDELAGMIEASRTIVCRSGYSTVMDLFQLGRSALLVPTPGQTEQEYLARYLGSAGLFQFVSQNDLSMGDLGIQSSADFLHREDDAFEQAIDRFMDQIRA